MVRDALETECSYVHPSISRLRDSVRQQQQENPNRERDHQPDCREQRVDFNDPILREQTPYQRGEQGDVNREIYPDNRHQLKVRKHSAVQGKEGDHRHDKESERCVEWCVSPLHTSIARFRLTIPGNAGNISFAMTRCIKCEPMSRPPFP